MKTKSAFFPTVLNMDQISMKDALDSLMTILNLFPVMNPHLWEVLLEHLTAHWKIKQPDSSDSEPLLLLLQTTCRLLKRSCSASSENPFDSLQTQLSAVLGDTSVTSLSWNLVKDVGNYFSGLVEAGVITPDHFSDGSKKRRTSTSFTTVHGVTDHADAAGGTTTTSEEALKSLFGDPSTSLSSTGSTGCMYSYISFCRNGRAERKYGLTEEYGDYRVVLKIYDGKTCRENPNKFWVGKEKELDMTLDRRDPLMRKINNLFLDAHEVLQSKGGDLKRSVQSHPFY